MSTPRTLAAYCKHGNSYCILCFAESKEGVAAPLEPSPCDQCGTTMVPDSGGLGCPTCDLALTRSVDEFWREWVRLDGNNKFWSAGLDNKEKLVKKFAQDFAAAVSKNLAEAKYQLGVQKGINQYLRGEITALRKTK